MQKSDWTPCNRDVSFVEEVACSKQDVIQCICGIILPLWQFKFMPLRSFEPGIYDENKPGHYFCSCDSTWAVAYVRGKDDIILSDPKRAWVVKPTSTA